jgi:alpha-ketoglutarate-dependent 2,4-dichlorophenoxyacetate dioxygenase
MTPTFRLLGPQFVAEVGPIDLRQVRDPATLAALRAGRDEYGVLVFRDQRFTDAEQLDFAQRFDGVLHAKTSASVIAKNRFGNEALTDISNVGADGRILAADDRRRVSGISNRLWHADASFEDPAGRYSMLSARVLPPVRADTEFADMRAAYDALDEATKRSLEGLRVHHSIVYSREVLGFAFTAEERARLPGALTHAHASHIVDWPVPEGRLLLRDLIEHATQKEFRFSHEWRDHDLVIWDNRATMHRARPFDDTRYRRELRRTTTLDLPHDYAAAAS